MLQALLRIFRKPPAPTASALEIARAGRVVALDAYRAAKTRGDTRTLHEAARALRTATTEVVRLEVGR